MNNISVRKLFLNSTSEHQGSRMELRRSSFYSTLDLVPQLEHYASTQPHSRSRPSLEALRRSFEVIHPHLNEPAATRSTSVCLLWHLLSILTRKQRQVLRFPTPPQSQDLASCPTATTEMRSHQLQGRKLL